MVKTENVSMKMRKAFSLFLILLFVLLCLVGCNNVSYFSKTVSITSYHYRYLEWFSLPIKATRYLHLPTSPIHFKSRMSLYKIYESINSNKNFEATYFETYVLVKDVSSSNLGYCLIYPNKIDKFNYAVSNMACKIKNTNAQYEYLEVLVPIHYIPSLIETQTLIVNEEYELNSTKNGVIQFYQENGYEVTDTNDKIIVRDTIGIVRKVQDEFETIIDVSEFEGIVELFEIVLNESNISFKIINK